jgi:hypothetical protein
MELAALPVAKEKAEISQWGAPPPPAIEKQEFDIFAFELWQRSSCPEDPVEEVWLDAEESAVLPH